MNLRDHMWPMRGDRLPDLPRAVRILARFAVALPALAFLVFVVAYGFKANHEIAAKITPILTHEISRQIGHEVRISHLRYAVPGIVYVEGITVSAGATFKERKGELAVSGRQAVIRYDLAGIIHDPQHALQYVKEIDLDHPYVLVERYSKTRFNFSDLFKPKNKKKKSLFLARIVVTDGRAKYRDYVASPRAATHLAENNLSAVNAKIDFGSTAQVVFAGTALGADGRVSDIGVSGEASRLVSGEFRLNVDAKNADVPYWQRYFSAAPGVRALTGKANLALSVAKLSKTDLALMIHGQASVLGGSAVAVPPKILRSTVQNISGSVVFTGNGVYGSGVGTVLGQPVTATAAIYDFKSPHIAATLSSSHIDPVRLGRALPAAQLPPGFSAEPGAARIQMSGSLTKPVIVAQVASPQGRYAGHVANNLRASFVIDRNVVTVPTASFDLAGGGHVVAQGATKVLGKLAYTFSGSAAAVNLASLAGHTPVPVTGTGDFRFLVQGVGKHPHVVIDAQSNDVSVMKTRLGHVTSRLSLLTNGDLGIERATIVGPSGSATVSGTVASPAAKPKLHLMVHAVNVHLSDMARPYVAADLGGIAYLKGAVAGTPTAPTFAGTARIFRPRYGRYAADAVDGRLTASRAGLRLNSVTVHRYPATASLTGTVTALNTADPVLNLDAKVVGADLHDLVAQLAKPADATKSAIAPSRKTQKDIAEALPTITGSADAKFHIFGTPRSPMVNGRIDVTGATVGAYRINSAQAVVAYAHDRASLSGVVIRSGTATVTASGHWAAPAGGGNPANGPIDAIISGSDVELQRFARYTRSIGNVQGNISFSGQLSGTLASPAVSFGLYGRDLTFNGQKLAEVTGFGRYENGVVSSAGTPWEFTFSGPLLGAPQTDTEHSAKYVIDAFQVALPSSAEGNGSTHIDVTAHIPADSPERLGHLVETIRQSRLADMEIGKDILKRLDALPRPLEATFYTPPDAGETPQNGTPIAAPPPKAALHIVGPVDALRLSGGLRVDGLKVGTNAVETLTLQGDYAPGPVATAHVTATGLKFESSPVDRLVADASIDHDIVTVPQITLSGDRSVIKASGHADLKGQIDASLEALGIPLTALNPWIGSMKFAAGDISDLSINASGSTRSPDLTASFDLTGPAIAVGPAAPQTIVSAAGVPPAAPSATPRYALERIRSGAIRLTTVAGTDTRLLSVSDITAFSGGKPVAVLTGTVPFRLLPSGPTLNGVSLALPVSANLTLDDLSVLASVAPGIDPARTGGKLVATLAAEPTASGRQLMGSVTIEKGSLGVQGIDTGLTDISATAALNTSTFTLQRLTAHSTRGGTIDLSGRMALGGEQVVSAKGVFDGFQINEASRQNLLARLYSSSLHGKITGSFSVAGPAASPLISTGGTPIVLTDASAVLPSAGPAEAQSQRPLPVDPRFDVLVQLGNERKTFTVGNAWLRADAYGNVSISGRLSAPVLSAPRLIVKKGQFIIPPATRIRLVGNNNEVVLNYPRPNPDPTQSDRDVLEVRVNLDAETMVAPSAALLASTVSAVNSITGQSSGVSQSSANDRQRYKIHVHINGVLGELNPNQLELTSDPPGLTKQQMLAALGQQDTLLALLHGGSNTGNVLSNQFSSALASIGVPMLLEPFETGLAQALGLSDFNVDYEPNAPVLLTLTKPITKKLSITYTKSFGAATTTTLNNPLQQRSPLYRIQMDYSLTRRLRIGVSTDNVQGTALSLNGLFSF